MIQLNWFNVSLIVGAVQSAFLLINISFLKKSHASNGLLKLLLSVIGISLILRLAYSPELYYSFPHLCIVADFVMFVFGPIYYLYVVRLLYENTHLNFRITIHFIPLLIFLVSIGYLFKFSASELVTKDMKGEMDGYYIVILSGAIMQIGAYLVLTLKEMAAYRDRFEQLYSVDSKVNFVNTTTGLMILGLLFWSVAFVASLFLPSSYAFLTNLSYQLAFLGLSLLVFVIGYFAIRQPEILRVTIEKKDKYSGVMIDESEMTRIRKKLESLFDDKKIYLKEDLSLNNLARSIGVNHTHLSRVINESYGKNFFDFVNSYRLKEFIKLAKSEEYNNYTLLGIAFEAGFKTKTTFNKFFKKELGTTPKEFLKKPDLEIQELLFNN